MGSKDGRRTTTSWKDPDLEWTESPRVRAATLDFASNADPHRPIAIVAQYPPNAMLPSHHHATDYMSIMVEGSMRIGKTWHERGSIRIVRQDTRYGPLLAGPEGCTVVDVFGDRTAFMPTGITEEDMKEYGLEQEIGKTVDDLGLAT